MSATLIPLHSEVAAELAQLQTGLDASELHGSLCGYLAGGGPESRGDWLARVMADAGAPAPVAEGALDRLYLASQQQLGSPDFEFEMLMPPTDAVVNERGDALLSWCRGFLGGFGLAAGAEPPLSEESAEALSDMARIAASDLDYEDPDTDEEALEEVAEFIRVAVMLLHSDCVLGPRHRRKLN